MTAKRHPVQRTMGLLLCLLLLLALLPSAYATNNSYPQGEGKLTVQFLHRYDGDKAKRMIPGVKASIYKVADLDEYAQFTLTSDFSASGADLNTNLSQEDWANLAVSLEDYVEQKQLKPMDEKTGGDDGTVRFTGLKPAMYLLIFGEGIHKDFPNIRVGFQTALLSMPNRGKNTANVFDLDASGVWDYDYTVIPKPYEQHPAGRLQKIWDDDNDAAKKRPKTLDVVIEYKDGVKQTLTLSAEKGWILDFEPASLSEIKKVTEPKLSDYYKQVKWEQTGITVQVTNKYTKPSPAPNPPEPLPQTGQLWWPVPVLLIAGAVLVLSGILRRRGKSRDGEK